MFLFLLRSLLGRLPSLLLTIVGLAVAFAASLAALSLHSVLSGGHPLGTHLAGNPKSIFTHSDARNLDAFLFPEQVIALQEELGDSGRIAASSGARMISTVFAGGEHEVAIDVVSPNFFEALGVSIRGGDASLFSDPRASPICVVSERFLARMGLTSAPATITVLGHTLQVIGVANGFSGLWDHETEMWVDWRLGHDILTPSSRFQPVDGIFWALAIPARGKLAEFDARLDRAVSRRDLIQPPFDAFKVIDGITNQAELRRSADTSSWLYLALCALMLTVATANLAAWSALMRAGKIESEWVFLRLGISRGRHALLGAGFVAIPAICASLLAPPLERLFSALLRQDSSIYALLAWSPDFKTEYPWRAWVLVIFLVTGAGWLLGLLVARVAGLSFASSTLRSEAGRVEKLFRPMAVIVSSLAAAALLFGALQCANTVRVWRSLSQQSAEQVWMMFLRPGVGASSAKLDSSGRTAVREAALALLPGSQAAGFVKIRPLSTAKEALSSYSLEPGGPPVLDVLLNEADLSGMQVIGAALRSGRVFGDSLSSMEIVLDTQAAHRLSRITGRSEVLGVTLYDVTSMPWRVVGVADRVAYGPDPDKDAPVAYVSLGDTPLILNLVVKGLSTRQDLADFVKSGVLLDAGRVKFGEPVRLSEQVRDALAQYRSRALLGMIAALITIAISGLTILAVVTLEVRRSRRRLAIRACLGESPLATAWQGAKGVWLAILGGTIMGMMAMLALRSRLVSLEMVRPSDFVWAVPACVGLLSALGAFGVASVLLREFFAQSLAQHLREE